MPLALSIADVERDTGLSKDTLRVWERRYGFPRPRRDALGERMYAPAQLEKLRVIKRLIDAGHRPGQLVPRTLGELRALSDGSRAVPATRGSRHDEVDALLEHVRGHDAAALVHGLAVAEARHGLRDFVIEVVAPLASRVGEAWMRGELRIFEEHLFTECVRAALYTALGGLPAAQHGPRVVLATLPGEPHSLGLLMAQTLLTLGVIARRSRAPRVEARSRDLELVAHPPHCEPSVLSLPPDEREPFAFSCARKRSNFFRKSCSFFSSSNSRLSLAYFDISTIEGARFLLLTFALVVGFFTRSPSRASLRHLESMNG